MLLKQATLQAVADGRITLQFRRWKHPTVKAGGTLLTSIGQLAIDSVDEVDPAGITELEVLAAGFASRGALLKVLDRPGGGAVYRVSLRLTGADPRIALRQEIPESEAACGEIQSRLQRWDRASPVGSWTAEILQLLADQPGVRAGDLAAGLGMDKARFKTNVRKLKGLGLTESLKVGYRLSPRGRAVLEFLASGD